MVSAFTLLMRRISSIQLNVREQGATLPAPATQKRVPVSSSCNGWNSGAPYCELFRSEMPYSERKLNLTSSRDAPRLVLITITPFAADEP